MALAALGGMSAITGFLGPVANFIKFKDIRDMGTSSTIGIALSTLFGWAIGTDVVNLLSVLSQNAGPSWLSFSGENVIAQLTATALFSALAYRSTGTALDLAMWPLKNLNAFNISSQIGKLYAPLGLATFLLVSTLAGANLSYSTEVGNTYKIIPNITGFHVTGIMGAKRAAEARVPLSDTTVNVEEINKHSQLANVRFSRAMVEINKFKNGQIVLSGDPVLDRALYQKAVNEFAAAVTHLDAINAYSDQLLAGNPITFAQHNAFKEAARVSGRMGLAVRDNLQFLNSLSVGNYQDTRANPFDAVRDVGGGVQVLRGGGLFGATVEFTNHTELENAIVALQAEMDVTLANLKTNNIPINPRLQAEIAPEEVIQTAAIYRQSIDAHLNEAERIYVQIEEEIEKLNNSPDIPNWNNLPEADKVAPFADMLAVANANIDAAYAYMLALDPNPGDPAIAKGFANVPGMTMVEHQQHQELIGVIARGTRTVNNILGNPITLPTGVIPDISIVTFDGPGGLTDKMNSSNSRITSITDLLDLSAAFITPTPTPAPTNTPLPATATPVPTNTPTATPVVTGTAPAMTPTPVVTGSVTVTAAAVVPTLAADQCQEQAKDFLPRLRDYNGGMLNATQSDQLEADLRDFVDQLPESQKDRFIPGSEMSIASQTVILDIADSGNTICR